MKKGKIKQKNKKPKGVTIIGVLVGITILGVALTAQIRLLGNTIRREVDLRNNIIATNLAREGLEIAFAWRVMYGWDTINNSDYLDKDLCADISNIFIRSANCNDNLYIQSTNFVYGVTQNPSFNVPGFWRHIRIESCNNGFDDTKCLNTISDVGWDPNDYTKRIRLEKKIYNWYVP